MNTRKFLAITSLIALLGLVLVSADAWARASGGGSRGSRSFSSPARPSSPGSSTTQSSPSRSMNQPAAPASPMAPQRSFFGGGLMGGLAGFAIGGLLGSMLFGGLGGGLGHGLGGIGLMDILLIGGGIVLLIMFLRRRRAQTAVPAYAGAGGSGSAYGATEQLGGGTSTITPEMPAAPESDLARGIGHIRSMDSMFEPAAVADTARRMFQGVQQAVTMRDAAWIREHLGNEMYAVLQDQCDKLRAAKRTNRVEKIEIGGADVTEAWQENGQDFVTVRLTGSMLDYTVDDASGNVVDGSNTTRTDVDEYWTFTRPVGPNRWKLSAIQTA
jgi:predicted lipid-binding transport protein (Tim44 family)